MLKRNLFLTTLLVALTSGCYTVSSHPDVYVPSDNGKLEMYELSVQENCFECHTTGEVEEYKKLMPLNQTDFAFAQNSYYLYSTYKVYDYYNSEPWWEDYEFTTKEEVSSNDDLQREGIDNRNGNEPVFGFPGAPQYYPPPTVSAKPHSSGSDNSSTQTKVRTNSSSKSGSATRNSSGSRSNNSRKKR